MAAMYLNHFGGNAQDLSSEAVDLTASLFSCSAIRAHRISRIRLNFYGQAPIFSFGEYIQSIS
jgi:hypothetical protein